MNGTLRILFILPLLFVSISATTDAYGHSLFNSSEQTLGDYRVQIATQPEFPQIGERSQILIRVTDQDGKEVDRFMMGNRIFYNEEQIITWRPESYDGGHMEKDFIFEESFSTPLWAALPVESVNLFTILICNPNQNL